MELERLEALTRAACRDIGRLAGQNDDVLVVLDGGLREEDKDRFWTLFHDNAAQI